MNRWNVAGAAENFFIETLIYWLMKTSNNPDD